MELERSIDPILDESDEPDEPINYFYNGVTGTKLMSEEIKMIDTYINDSINETWNKIGDTSKIMKESEIGSVISVKKPWFNDVCEDILNQRNHARNQWLNDQYNKENEAVYKKCQKRASRIFKREKKKFTRKLLEEAKADSKMKRRRLVKCHLVGTMGTWCYQRSTTLLLNKRKSEISHQGVDGYQECQHQNVFKLILHHHHHLMAAPCRDSHMSLSFATFLSCE
ncbi:Hypothetical protein CINCED_3A012235 [Cinara cedri]|uniref:Uncharacterized protein n=1 Tax=Cinara cedri TaxID=506608 RepID=A0A5E4MQR3_9HEMI|nr:Hypothetical protein CINCED_3A012235 [Cinara cedri]